MRNVMPKRIFGVVGVAALLLAACGDDDDKKSDSTDSGGGDSASALTVCTDAPYPPFEFEDEDSGEFTGFDMELLREIASRMDRELDVTVQPFDGIWLAPQAGTCDVVASAMTITDDRKEGALFSDPYFDANQSLLVRTEDKDTYNNLEKLAGKKIGVQLETTGETYANDHKPDGSEVVSFEDPAAMFLALESGEVDALLQDFPVNAYRATQDDGMTVVEQYQTNEEYGFAAAKDNQDLIDEINDKLAETKEDGFYDDLYAEWFGEEPSS
jgi:polar amino acid transport system substrate-binding protein